MNWQDRQGCNTFVTFLIGALIIAGVVAIFLRLLSRWCHGML